MSTTPPTYAPPPQAWRPPPPPAVAPNGQPLASFSDRLLAYLIDQAVYIGISLVWAIPFTIWWVVHIFSWVEQHRLDSQPPELSEFLEIYTPMLVLFPLSILFGVLFTYLYFLEYQLRKGGQTVGKRVMKIRIIPADPQAALTRVAMAKRWGVQWIVAMFVPFFGWMDGLWQLWDKPLQQCLHDKAATTVVVKVG